MVKKNQAREGIYYFIILRTFFMWHVMAKLKYIVSCKKTRISNSIKIHKAQ